MSQPTAAPVAGHARPGAQQRGEDTRLRILRTALQVFATEGYDGASTRTLAQRANVNLPALQYYFGNKEGLYRAVIDHISEIVEHRIAPVTEQIRARLAAGAMSRIQVLDLLCLMLDAFVALVTDQNSPDWESRAMFFARAEIEQQTALDTLHQRVTRQIVEPCAVLIGQLTDQAPDAEQTLLRTVAVLGQVSVFCNRKAHEALGWQHLDDTRVRAIQALVREHTKAIFRVVKGGVR
ncbi:MAG TPA: CerR family C-terminal domain-containing protein [Acetobacteraceae bacterium]|jgi:AcrR family transcriptional regulator|nr:CerR family C-terminal domain-containing protein [Acetobacteraceae bacterium]